MREVPDFLLPRAGVKKASHRTISGFCYQEPGALRFLGSVLRWKYVGQQRAAEPRAT